MGMLNAAAPTWANHRTFSFRSYLASASNGILPGEADL